MTIQSNEHLVIQLLIQDMKHEQLIRGMQSLGFNSNVHGSNISTIVAGLMGIKEDDISWEWMDVYMSFIKQATNYEITDTGSSLQQLANTCYSCLLEIV